jgi:hypothetical protein
MTNNFKQLETAGYIVIPDFLTQEELNLFKEDYLSSADVDNKNYLVSRCSDKVLKILIPKFENLARIVAENTNINTDRVVGTGAYFSTDKINFPWHQDHEPYYKWQDSYNALNFWIPIIKSNNNQSGLDVINFESFKHTDTKIVKEKLIGKGAKSFIPRKSSTLVNDDDAGNNFLLNTNLDDIKFSPTVSIGDLLLMRQDVIHKTQDTDDFRVSVSIRTINSNNEIFKNKFYDQCDKKMEMINNNKPGFKDVIEIFEYQEKCYIRDVLTKKDL